MNALLVLALFATGMAIGGVAATRYQDREHLRISLLRDHDDETSRDD